jgi:hypothetical protein
MFELFIFTLFTYLFYRALAKSITKLVTRLRKPHNLDAELRQLIESSSDNTAIALEIKTFLLDLINDAKNDHEKFSDPRINQAQGILDRAGPSAFYWMTEISAQLCLLAAAQINGIPTNVSAELGSSATAEDIVRIVVKV